MILTQVLALPLCGLNHFLVLALTVVREPSGDLLLVKACLLREHGFVLGPEIRVVDVVEEPVLQHEELGDLKGLHAFQTLVLNLT